MLSLSSLSIDHGDLPAVRDLTIDVGEGTFAALVGPSGCGKSTVLRCIAGLQEAARGSVSVRGRVGMVFQDAALFPWLTVEKNVGFALSVRGAPRAERERVVNEYLATTGLTEFRDCYPHVLSGGMKQRCAIARTLAADPSVVLMDEPFAALDAFTRSAMQEFLLSLWETGKKTILFVTHDVEEAVFLADTVHVLSPRPATLLKSFPVPFPRPRQHALKLSREFFDVRNAVLECLGPVTSPRRP